MSKTHRTPRLWYRLEQRHADGTCETSEARQYPDFTELMRVTDIWARAAKKPGDVFTWYANEQDAVTGWRAVLSLEVKNVQGGGLVLYPLPLGRRR